MPHWSSLHLCNSSRHPQILQWAVRRSLVLMDLNPRRSWSFPKWSQDCCANCCVCWLLVSCDHRTTWSLSALSQTLILCCLWIHWRPRKNSAWECSWLPIFTVIASYRYDLMQCWRNREKCVQPEAISLRALWSQEQLLYHIPTEIPTCHVPGQHLYFPLVSRASTFLCCCCCFQVTYCCLGAAGMAVAPGYLNGGWCHLRDTHLTVHPCVWCFMGTISEQLSMETEGSFCRNAGREGTPVFTWRLWLLLCPLRPTYFSHPLLHTWCTPPYMTCMSGCVGVAWLCVPWKTTSVYFWGFRKLNTQLYTECTSPSSQL